LRTRRHEEAGAHRGAAFGSRIGGGYDRFAARHRFGKDYSKSLGVERERAEDVTSGKQTRQGDVTNPVVFTRHAPDEELPVYYSARNVFAMPRRSRWRGLDVEGLGIVYLDRLPCSTARRAM
jgi:glycosyltransferase involved in cell wall biosynthesis